MSQNPDAHSYLVREIQNRIQAIPDLAQAFLGMQVTFELPANSEHGDLATSIAFQLGKKLKRNPREVAVSIMTPFGWDEAFVVADPTLGQTIKGPGFINFRYSQSYLNAQLGRILSEGANYGHKPSNGKRALLEFVSANPTGPMVVVNARAAAIGDCLARMHAFEGWAVQREYYVNDAGNQVRLLGASVDARYRELLGQTVSLPEEGYHGQYIVEIARKIMSEMDKEPLSWNEQQRIERFARIALDSNLAQQKEALCCYGVAFDSWQSEKELHDKGYLKRVEDVYRSKDLLYEHEGAVWLRTSRYHDEKDRVFVTSKGFPTYLFGDAAYHLHKAERGFDRYVTLWGPDHHGYIPNLEAAIEALGVDKSRFTNLIVQQVNLLREGQAVKMSKRAGEFVTLDDLVAEVGVDAARYFFLMRRLNSHFDFDLDLAKKKSEDNPVFYVQYAHARISSVLRNALEQGRAHEGGDPNLLVSPEETALIKKLIQYPDLVRGALKALETQRIPAYLEELAAAFHLFYQHHRVIGDDVSLSAARLALVRSAQIVFAGGLGILGVSAPERM